MRKIRTRESILVIFLPAASKIELRGGGLVSSQFADSECEYLR